MPAPAPWGFAQASGPDAGVTWLELGDCRGHPLQLIGVHIQSKHWIHFTYRPR